MDNSTSNTMNVNQRSIGMAIFMSIITLGIYGIYWYYLLVQNVRVITGSQKGCGGEVACIMFVPFYSLYWWYTRGETVKNEFTKRRYNVSISGAIALVLSLFGLGIIAMAIMQNDFNSLSKATPNQTDSLDWVEKLKALRELLDAGDITQEEFDQAKAQLMAGSGDNTWEITGSGDSYSDTQQGKLVPPEEDIVYEENPAYYDAILKQETQRLKKIIIGCVLAIIVVGLMIIGAIAGNSSSSKSASSSTSTSSTTTSSRSTTSSVSVKPTESVLKQRIINKCCDYSDVDSIKGLTIGTFDSDWSSSKSKWVTTVKGYYYPVDEYGSLKSKVTFTMTFEDYEVKSMKIS